jgi:hypothetical protein
MKRETILVVEDEAIVAADVASKLSHLGYGQVPHRSTRAERADAWDHDGYHRSQEEPRDEQA